ncbi:hypothetical protein A2482_04365 [Candidatus Falkowbacteria bacterium RIFOXYC2_FULL_48_21]|uniref:Uncharacterized protein n=1 Tax=Candidatus Falkowbacteria bacterium RIFOXYC2_FULL_48_21 TaxID=1798005 RepID=A0A1F5TAX4_9BACT|nr:MAG: hypothetical protein A2482_04365 [Candidatus Falkowbacteria bacterium RIFOXYC2_FULL_48_21]
MDFGKKQDNAELVKLINDSFLVSDEKKALLEIYSREGASAAFLQKFESALVEKLRQKTETAIGLDKVIETEFARITDDYNKQRASLTEKLQKELADVAPGDVTAKTTLWDAYYVKVDELQKVVAGGIQAVSQKVLIGMTK